MNKIRIASRIFNTPLLIHPDKLQAILAGIGDRLEIDVDHLDGPDAEFGRSREAFATRFGTYNRDLGFHLDGNVGVIGITGTLVHKGAWLGSYSGLTSYEGISEQFARALEAPQVQSIVLNLHSYGGEVAGCFDLADEIFEARGTKPIVALIADASASACYALASAADEVVVTQTALTGSIGVVMTHFDWSARMKAEGVKVTHIHAGKEKVLGSPYMPLSEADQAKLQAEVDDVYQIFVEKVARNRAIDPQAVKGTEAGVFGPGEAIRLGLADRVSTGRELIASLNGRVSTGGPARSTMKSKETSMSEKENGPSAEKAITEQQLTAAKAKSFEEGCAKGAKQERQRVAGILNSEHAEGREAQAKHVALNTGLSVEEAGELLAASPKVAEGAGGGLAKAMANIEQPDVGPGGDDPDDKSDEAQASALAQSIINA